MTRRRIFAILGWGAALGIVLATLNGEEQVISLEIWLAGFGTSVAVTVLLHLLRLSPNDPTEPLGLFRRSSRQNSVQVGARPRELRLLEGLVIRARENERAHALQLRPRLTAIAAHNLSVHHGLDIANARGQAAAILGPTAWMIDPTVNDRTPTLEEVDSFVDRVTDATPPTSRTSRT